MAFSELDLYEVPVRQAKCLPPASFRFHLTMETLALGCVSPAIKAHSGLTPVRHCSCRAYTNNSPPDWAGDYCLDRVPDAQLRNGLVRDGSL